MYDENFYKNQVEGSYEAARVVCRHLRDILIPKTVIDIGCGKGAWLRAMVEEFSCETHGVDGPWVKEEEMFFRPSKFMNRDLNENLELGLDAKVELLITLEVAEHLLPDSSDRFIAQITDASDCILFSAAQKGQGGIYHFNEKLPSDWAFLFEERGFVCFDLLRSKIAGDYRVPFWYQQNMALYVRDNSEVCSVLTDSGNSPLHNLRFLNMVSSDFYLTRISFKGFFKYQLLRILPPRLVSFLHGIFG